MPRGVPKGKKKQTDEERKATKSVKAKKYYSSEHGKTTVKKYQQSEQGKANLKKYLASGARNASVKKYYQTEQGNATIQRASKKYKSSEKGKAKIKEYNASEHGKARMKKFQSSEKGKKAIQLKVLKHFSKLHSNSYIPCCRCCGLNDHTDFLAVDHIQGKKQMDSIPELKKLGYSSEDQELFKWIIDNNYLSDLKTEYFQILCHNCNQAKAFLKNKNKCPHEIMRQQ